MLLNKLTLQIFCVTLLLSGCLNQTESLFNTELSSEESIDSKSDNSVLNTVSLSSAAVEKPTSDYPYRAGDDIPASAYLDHQEVYNRESVIPPQCYTKTEGENNPCYACHQTYIDDKTRSNQMQDGRLQGQYDFSDLGTSNHWKNLFVDRRELIKAISNEFITQWVNQDNYTDFIEKQQSLTNWKGEITPIENLAFPTRAFDNNGLASDDSKWVAYNYKPFPSTFWPTNGSTGDAMIRLPESFRQLQGQYNQDLYFANLALVEMVMKDVDTISTLPISEIKLNMDLNNDGQFTLVERIDRQDNYLGDAQHIALSHQLYPQGTEFLHTVRYIGVNDEGQIYNAPRLKELRYMKKHNFKSTQRLASEYYLEQKEKNSENLPQINYLGDKGINTNFGWTINGYIEDSSGELRQQHKQELAFCGGCHKTIGGNLDQTFSFPRKVSGKKGWGYINLATQTDVPNIGEKEGEILTYLARVGGGDEFRQNKEMLGKWFNHDGTVNRAKVKNSPSLYDLITPSPQRANQLNKAYYTLMKEQSYLFGRDAMLSKADNVLQTVDENAQPLKPEFRYQWDLRLDWSH